MTSDDTQRFDRRTLLAALGTGSALALAGCSGDGEDEQDGDDSRGTTPTGTPTEAGVPAEYRTATALNGQRRDPTSLSSKAAVNYQSTPSNGQQCSGCRFYIEDRNGDGQGACAVVAGTIDPSAYCASYAPLQADGSSAPSTVEVPDDAECAVCGMGVANFPAWNAQAVHEDETRAFFCTSGCATTYYAATSRFATTDASLAGLWVRDFESSDLIDATSASYALETDSDRVDDPMRLNPAPFATREDAVAYVDAVDYLSESDIVSLSAFDETLAGRYRGRFLE
jgi:nitrous oxide reductase accessory protein NosL